MTWVLWLLLPVVVTVVAAALSWLRSRPARRLDTDGAMRAHADYLDALVHTARSKDRGPLAGAVEQPPGVPELNV